MTDYEAFFSKNGITDGEDKRIVLDFVSTLFNIAIEFINNQLNKETDDRF